MGDLILETCADIFGVTQRGRLGTFLLTCGLGFLLGLLLMQEWGALGFLPPALLFALAAGTAHDVTRARDAVWRAACLPLDDARQPPERGAEGRLIPPTAVMLYRLAAVVNHVRRGAFVAAEEMVSTIERRRLRAEEEQLLDAARAMILLGLGDARGAAQRASTALPTGSLDLDLALGRAMVAEAWNAPDRLQAIARAWTRAGVSRDPRAGLPRLQMLLRVRIDADALAQVKGPDARDLSDEARAIGDEDLAAELDARAHPRAYR